MILACAELVNFMLINVFTDELDGEGMMVGNSEGSLANGIVSAIIWLVAVVLEIMQFLGYAANGLMKRYLMTPRYWIDFAVLIMTGYFIYIFLMDSRGMNIKETAFSTVLGILLFLKWFRMLVHLRQFEVVGVRILPITSTMWDVGPFLLVLVVYVLASVNLLYALRNNYSSWECFLLIYRLVVMGDMDITELEHRAKPLEIVDLATGEIRSINTHTEYRGVVSIVAVVLSFVIGVTMMNLFIAMLCLSYEEAAHHVNLTFAKSRVNIVLDQHAVCYGLSLLRDKCVCQCLMRKAKEHQRRKEDDSVDVPVMMSRGNSSGLSINSSFSSRGSTLNLNIRQSSEANWLTADTILKTAERKSRTAFLWYVEQTSFED
jgi:hypothetical protein